VNQPDSGTWWDWVRQRWRRWRERPQRTNLQRVVRPNMKFSFNYD
jgi:hypothetical protein